MVRDRVIQSNDWKWALELEDNLATFEEQSSKIKLPSNLEMGNF